MNNHNNHNNKILKLKYDYIIYGGGPVGLVLALIFSSNNKKVALVEKRNVLGGCWAVEWADDKYFSEHSPRAIIYDNTIKNLLEELGLDESSVSDIYKKGQGDNLSLFKDMYDKFTLKDIVKLSKVYLEYIASSVLLDKISVKGWCDKNNISEKAQIEIYKISLVLADVPEKLLISDFIEGTIVPTFNRTVQFKNPELWVNKIVKKITKNGGDIYMNTELIQVNDGYSIIKNNTNSLNIQKLYGKKQIFCIDPLNLHKILVKSNLLDNWNLGNTLIKSYYSSYAFQIHFYNKIKIPTKWFWSFVTKYNTIVLDASEYTEPFSKDKNVKCVLSCTITNQDLIGYDKEKIIKNAVSQIMEILEKTNDNIGKFIITVNEMEKNTYNNGIKFNSELSGYVRRGDIITSYGKRDDIAIVGMYNLKGVSTINSSIKSAIVFAENEIEKPLKHLNSNKINSSNTLLIILVFCIIISIFYFFIKNIR